MLFLMIQAPSVSTHFTTYPDKLQILLQSNIGTLRDLMRREIHNQTKMSPLVLTSLAARTVTCLLHFPIPAKQWESLCIEVATRSWTVYSQVETRLYWHVLFCRFSSRWKIYCLGVEAKSVFLKKKLFKRYMKTWTTWCHSCVWGTWPISPQRATMTTSNPLLDNFKNLA